MSRLVSRPTPTPVRRLATPARIIATDADVQAGVRALRRKCPVMRHVHDATGDPPLRRREAGFAGLARIIVGQQVSVASADAIWARTFLVADPFDAAGMLAATDAALRGAGLSRGKIKTLRAAAGAIADGLDIENLAGHDDAAVQAMLTDIPGIGPWTSDVFVMFCLGRADVFAPGDLALQIAAQAAMGLDARPTSAALGEIAERWRPWRAVAARLLWSYYRVARPSKVGVPV